MNIFFRVDASIEIGSGHVMRCLTLADELKSRGEKVIFITRAHKGNMGDAIKKRGYELCLLPAPADTYQIRKSDVRHAPWLGVSWEQDAKETSLMIGSSRPEWLIVDHYGIDSRWHKDLRNKGGRIMAIDDLADRKLDCDLILDQTYGRKVEEYRPWVSPYCKMMLGSSYALLRPQFAEFRHKATLKRKKFNGINRILISMGGVDVDNVTTTVLNGLLMLNWEHIPLFDVILSRHSPHLQQVIERFEKQALNISVSTDVTDMAERMLSADIAIGAGGSTSWERCCLGLPSLIITTASNQAYAVKQLQAQGSIISIGRHSEDTAEMVFNSVTKLIDDIEMWYRMVEKAFNITSGLGASLISSALDTSNTN